MRVCAEHILSTELVLGTGATAQTELTTSSLLPGACTLQVGNQVAPKQVNSEIMSGVVNAGKKVSLGNGIDSNREGAACEQLALVYL